MENLLELVLFILTSITIALCSCIPIHIFTNLLSKNKYKLKYILYSFLILLPFSCAHLFILLKYPNINWILPPIIVYSMYIMISLVIYKTPKLKSILVLIATIIFSFIIDLLGVFVVAIMGKDTSFISESNINYFLFAITTNILATLLLMFVCYIVFNKKTLLTLKEHYKYLIYQAIIIVVCLIPTMYLMFSDLYDYAISFVIINLFQIVIVSIFSVVYLKNGIQFKDTKLELENTKLHNKALSTINENIRGFKHDMGNMVQSINGYLAVGNIDGVKNYCKHLLQGFNDINLLSILSPKIINDPAIYGIVVSKMLYARDNKLTLSLDVNLDVSQINFPSFELSRIIGILLDNAIEAALESDEKKLKLEMFHDENRKRDIIIIGNSIKDSNKVDIIKMFEKDYSTKENPSGFGLYEVLKFLKKHNKGDIVPNIDYDNNFFTQTLTFDN